MWTTSPGLKRCAAGLANVSANPHTVVTWTLENSGGATRLMLVHSGFEADTWTEE